MFNNIIDSFGYITDAFESGDTISKSFHIKTNKKILKHGIDVDTGLNLKSKQLHVSVHVNKPNKRR